MVELSRVLDEVRHRFGIASWAEVPRSLVVEALTRELNEDPDADIPIRDDARVRECDAVGIDSVMIER